MAAGQIRTWTLCNLAGAFLDLALAYFVLCAAAVAFFAAKFLSLLGVRISLSSFLNLSPPRLTSLVNSLFPAPESSNSPRRENLAVRSSLRRKIRRRNFSDREGSRKNLSETAESYYSPREGIAAEIIEEGCSFASHEQKSYDLSSSKDLEIRVLKEALEQERASFSLLSLELEKERSAAASAAEEAMAMILRLQKEKAGVEMEFRQYQRMVDEKNAYDEEERDIMNDIILMREMEKHVLMRENELYRHILTSGERIEQKKLDEIVLLASSYDERKREKSFEERESQYPEERERGGRDADRNCTAAVDLHTMNPEAEVEERETGLERERADRRVLHSVDSAGGMRRIATSAVDRKRLTVDTELDFLGERLKLVQRGRERKNLSLEYSDKENFHLQLLEEVASQLREIKRLTEPNKATWQSSERKKRRCQSFPSSLHRRT